MPITKHKQQTGCHHPINTQYLNSCSDQLARNPKVMTNKNLFKANKVPVKSGVTASALINGSNGVHDRGVVTSSEISTDLLKAESGVFFSPGTFQSAWEGQWICSCALKEGLQVSGRSSL